MYRHQQDPNYNAGSEQQYQLPTNNSFNYSGFGPGPIAAMNMMEPAFQNNPQHLSPSLRQSIPRQTPHSRHSSGEWHSRQRQASGSPALSHAVPASTPSFVPTDRALPSTDVDANTITDAYVAFILYCNPNFDLDVDTTTLRTNFQSPPKSDNKDFEVYRLFELIRKFDAKEIKTWGQLALDLGVEAPDVSKGQSVQKVQQYSVRLKRWMRAMHVDAFFEYLLGKQHAYSNEVPHPSDPYPSNGRDGVMAEEDLAIRALDPSFRPKRGRRRNSEVEQDEEAEAGATQTQHDTTQLPPQSAVPQSAHPMTAVHQFNPEHDFHQHHDPWAAASAVTPQSFAPWMRKTLAPQTAVTTSAPSHLRWQLHGNTQNPMTPHPMTALPGSMHAHIEAAFEDPKSAITPSSRKRRKHGPAVSSAWSSTNTPGAKPRGRPPASRNTQDGPFTTFPADPANDKTGGATYLTPMSAMDKNTLEIEQTSPNIPVAVMQPPREGSGRPGKLSLQVPPHTGGPVRLATPPRVVVTSETSGSERQPSIEIEPPSETEVQDPSQQRQQSAESIGFTFEMLKRVLASDLLRAELIGRRTRLNGEEAKRLAEAVLDRLNIKRSDDDLARLTAASWLGLGGHLNVPLGPATGQHKRITITRFRTDTDGYEEIVSAVEEFPGQTRDVYDLSWTASMGGCNGSFELKTLSLASDRSLEQDDHDRIVDTFIQVGRQFGMPDDWMQARKRDFDDPNFAAPSFIPSAADQPGVDWKAKYKALEFGSRMAKGEFNRFRQRLVETILDLVI